MYLAPLKIICLRERERESEHIGAGRGAIGEEGREADSLLSGEPDAGLNLMNLRL